MFYTTAALRYIRLVFFVILLSSCKRSDREAANHYYQDFSRCILPYKEGTERILNQVQSLLREELKSSGSLKLSHDDSIKQLDLLREFEILSRKTIDDIDALEDFSGSDLKASALEYVQRSSKAVLGAFREVAIPMQDILSSPDQHVIDSLSDRFSDDLVKANEEFAARQLEFLKKFDLLRTENGNTLLIITR